MARSSATILKTLTTLAPGFISDTIEGVALLKMLGQSVLDGENYVDTLTTYVTREGAPLAWLISLAKSRGITREPWETKEDLAARAFIHPRGCTTPYIKSELLRQIAPKGYKVTITSPTLLFCDLDEGFGLFCDLPTHLVYEQAPLYGLAIMVPLVEVVDVGQGFADLEAGSELALVADLDDGLVSLPYRVDLDREPYHRMQDALTHTIPGGTAFRLEIRDTIQPVHLPLIYRTYPGQFFTY